MLREATLYMTSATQNHLPALALPSGYRGNEAAQKSNS